MKPDFSGEAKAVLFEPWSLGDVMIAASSLRELPYPAALASHPAWHRILRAALREHPDHELIPVDLPYTTRDRSHALDFSDRTEARSPDGSSLVLSIRGDLRDYLAARRLFPHARIKMTGWIRFFARKNSLVDFPYRVGLFPMENRYHSWAKLTGIPFRQIETTYRQKQIVAPKNGRVVIHVGAQWRSKQFPHVPELRELLQRDGREVILAASKSDSLPPNLPSAAVPRLENEALLELLQSAEQVITNDSGPMHVAAFLGCRTTVIARAASIEEWLPPATRLIAAPDMPKGYRQRKHYMTDDVLPGWPEAAGVAESLARS